MVADRASMMVADFTGAWEMDLSTSEFLGPTLRELGVNRMLASVITRLGVRQSISQDEATVRIKVSTALSADEINLALDGSVTKIQGVAGGKTAATSRWLTDERLETRQALLEDAPAPDASSADAFVTVRSLEDGGSSLLEEVSVFRRGKTVPGTRARRVLRRTEQPVMRLGSAVASATPAGGGGRRGLRVAAAFGALGAGCVLALGSTLRAQPLFPFRLDSMAWLSTWLWMTVLDYYGATLPLVGIICATEKPRSACLWSAACLLLGSPFCCAYVALRAWRHGSLRLEEHSGAAE